MKFLTAILLTTGLVASEHIALARSHTELDAAPVHAAETFPIDSTMPALVLLTCNDSVVGGGMFNCEAWLTAEASSDTQLNIALLGTSREVAAVPTMVTWAAGKRKLSIPIATRPVAKPTPITLQVSYAGQTLSATRTVLPPTLEDFRLNHSQIVGGATTSMRVILTGPAPAGGFAISLKSSREDVVPVPRSLVVPADARAFTVELTSRPVARETTVMLFATAPTSDETRSFPLHVAKDAPPDLMIANWSYRDSEGPIEQMPYGRPFQLCVDVTNRSLTKAPPSRVRLIMLTSTGQDLSLEASIKSLPPGGSAHPCFSMPALDPGLQYTFNMYADYGNALQEDDKSNNMRAFEAERSMPRRPPPPPPAPAAHPAPASQQSI